MAATQIAPLKARKDRQELQIWTVQEWVLDGDGARKLAVNEKLEPAHGWRLAPERGGEALGGVADDRPWRHGGQRRAERFSIAGRQRAQEPRADIVSF